MATKVAKVQAPSPGQVVNLGTWIIIALILLGIYRMIKTPMDAFDSIRDFWRWLLFGETYGDSERFGPDGGAPGQAGQGSSGSAAGSQHDRLLARAETFCQNHGGVSIAVTGGGNPFCRCNDGSNYDLLTGRLFRDF